MFWIIIVLVFLNTCVLATEHYKQPKWLDYFQDVTNLFFVVLFTCEMLIKMYALGLQVGGFMETPLMCHDAPSCDQPYCNVILFGSLTKLLPDIGFPNQYFWNVGSFAHGFFLPPTSQGYSASLFNKFDCFVVTTSIIELVLTKCDVMPPIGLSVLRSVRLLRAFKVTR